SRTVQGGGGEELSELLRDARLVTCVGVAVLGHEQQVSIGVATIANHLQSVDCLRPEGTASLNPCLGTWKVDPATVEVDRSHWQLRTVRVAEPAVQCQQNHRLEFWRLGLVDQLAALLRLQHFAPSLRLLLPERLCRGPI